MGARMGKRIKNEDEQQKKNINENTIQQLPMFIHTPQTNTHGNNDITILIAFGIRTVYFNCQMQLLRMCRL